MGKSLKKRYVIISGFNIRDNNRGTAALSYGSVSFLCQHGWLNEEHTLLNIRPIKNPFKKKNKNRTETIAVDDKRWMHETFCVSYWEYYLFVRYSFRLPFSRFIKKLKKIDCVAAINGGDGFSDIYNTKTFIGRLREINIAIANGIPLILLPQTLGPFKQRGNMEVATRILQYAKKVYVRDDKFIGELKRMGVEYEKTNDLSYYMKPEPWDIQLISNSIGINVSGLTYSNKFHSLEGLFENYPALISELIERFTNMGQTVYLIPHSYNYHNPESNNDDLQACRAVYASLEQKERVVLIDKDMTSPQVKYLISQMSFFVGTRMHACFAAIYTNIPVFGLAYSYKFKGGFESCGLDGEALTADINNISQNEIRSIVEKILETYQLYKDSIL